MSAADIARTEQRFGERLRRIRRAKGLTGPELAALAGMPTSSIYRIEGGVVQRRATVGEAAVLAGILGVGLEVLVGVEGITVTVPLGVAR